MSDRYSYEDEGNANESLENIRQLVAQQRETNNMLKKIFGLLHNQDEMIRSLQLKLNEVQQFIQSKDA